MSKTFLQFQITLQNTALPQGLEAGKKVLLHIKQDNSASHQCRQKCFASSQGLEAGKKVLTEDNSNYSNTFFYLKFVHKSQRYKA